MGVNIPFKAEIDEIIDEITHILVLFQRRINSMDAKIKAATDFILTVRCMYQFSEAMTPLIHQYVDGNANDITNSRIALEILTLRNVFEFNTVIPPPYYTLRIDQSYLCKKDYSESTYRFINFTMPEWTGRSRIAPLFVASRIYENNLSSPLIFMTRCSQLRVKSMKKYLKTQCQDSFTIAKNLEEMQNLYIQTTHYKPAICVLSEIDLVMFLSNNGFDPKIFEHSYFIIDDISERNVETDSLIGALYRPLKSIKGYSAHLMLLSSYRDEVINEFAAMKELSVKTFVPFNTEKIEKEGKSVREINDRYVVETAANVLTNWETGSDEIDASKGPIIIFLPSHEECLRFIMNFKSYTNNKNVRAECPIFMLKTTLRPNESAKDFYQRIQTDLEFLKIDNEAIIKKKVSFMLPIILDESMNQNMREIYQARFPFEISFIVKVFLVHTRTESFLNMNDISVIIESGLCDDIHSDFERGLTYVVEEHVPMMVANKRFEKLGHSHVGTSYLFRVENKEIPLIFPQHIIKDDISKSILHLRAAGLKFEEILDLPTKAPQESIDKAIKYLGIMGILDDNSNLTNLGKQSKYFTCLQPVLAVSAASFSDNKFDGSKEAALFASFVFLIIEHGENLVSENVPDDFLQYYCNESDIVTILRSTREVFPIKKENKKETDDFYLSKGFNPLETRLIISNLRQIMQKLYNTNDTFSANFAKMWNWFDNLHNDLLSVVDSLIETISSIDSNWLSIREGNFDSVLGVGYGCPLTVMFEGHSLLNAQNQNDSSSIRLQHRPGWKGFSVPGNCYLLSINSNRSNGINTGHIVHRHLTKHDNMGVVTIDAPDSFQTPFFVPLVDAYWGHKPSKNDFVSIHMGKKNEAALDYLTHISKWGNHQVLNFCPKTEAIKQELIKAINIIENIMPFVGRSIILRIDEPECACEIVSNGCFDTTKNVHFYADPNPVVPTAYNLNAAVLEWLSQNTVQLRKSDPHYRIAITGECCLFKEVNGQVVDIPVEYPNIDPDLNAVFCEKPSHLVLLVDKSMPMILNEIPIPWKLVNKQEITIGNNEDQNLVDLADLHVRGHGYAHYCADAFYVIFNDNTLYTDRGQIPTQLRKNCQSPDGKMINCHIFDLARFFKAEYFKKQKLADDESIPLSSLKIDKIDDQHKSNFKSNPVQRFLQDAPRVIGNKLNIPEDNIKIAQCGPEGFKLRIEGIPANLLEKKADDLFSLNYVECEAQRLIKEAVNELGLGKCTKVMHQRLLTFVLNRINEQHLSEEEFDNIIQRIVRRYGFFVFHASGAIDPIGNNPRVLTTEIVDFIDPFVAISFSDEIHEAININEGETLQRTITQTMTLMKQSILRKSRDAQIGYNETAYSVTSEELEKARALMQKNGIKIGNMKFDEKYQLLIVPEDEQKAVQNILSQTLAETLKAHEYFTHCDEPPEYLPSKELIYDQDGTCTALAVCQKCLKVELVTYLEKYYNPITNHLDMTIYYTDRNIKTPKDIGCPIVDHEDKELNEKWPQRPFAQFLWILLMSPELANLAKAWVTSAVNVELRVNPTKITMCPDHPAFLLKIPTVQGQSIKCRVCDQWHCGLCSSWHRIEDKCADDKNAFKRRCPKCLKPMYKTRGCNHIECECGAHWCYYCGGLFTHSTIYPHMREAHGKDIYIPLPDE